MKVFCNYRLWAFHFFAAGKQCLSCICLFRIWLALDLHHKVLFRRFLILLFQICDICLCFAGLLMILLCKGDILAKRHHLILWLASPESALLRSRRSVLPCEWFLFWFSLVRYESNAPVALNPQIPRRANKSAKCPTIDQPLSTFKHLRFRFPS